ncbi:MAG TPA: response regulator [bacterium]|nr:response regulator [bacterium]
MKVMIIDDDVVFASELAQAIASAGYAVECCHDSVAAVNRVQAAKPDLMLLDISMPRLNGYQVAYYLRRFQDTAKIPIVGISAFAEKLEANGTGSAFGMDAFMAKPIVPEALLALIGRLVQAPAAGIGP